MKWWDWQDCGKTPVRGWTASANIYQKPTHELPSNAQHLSTAGGISQAMLLHQVLVKRCCRISLLPELIFGGRSAPTGKHRWGRSGTVWSLHCPVETRAMARAPPVLLLCSVSVSVNYGCGGKAWWIVSIRVGEFNSQLFFTNLQATEASCYESAQLLQVPKSDWRVLRWLKSNLPSPSRSCQPPSTPSPAHCEPNTPAASGTVYTTKVPSSGHTVWNEDRSDQLPKMDVRVIPI